MVDPTLRLLDFFWSSFLLLAPMLLLGLLLAGLIHVLISREAILKWLSGDSLGSVCVSAAIGVPVPLCSCSVVPVVAEMHKKGASRSSSMSFLITAPETGADSILVTHAFFGVVAAVVRPLVSFVTAVVAGVFCIAMGRRGATEGQEPEHSPQPVMEHSHCDLHGHDGHSHGGHKPLYADQDDCYVSPGQLKEMMFASRTGEAQAQGPAEAPGLTLAYRAFSTAAAEPSDGAALADLRDLAPSDAAEPDPERPKDGPSLWGVIKHVFHYGFVETADDILFALLVGILLGGALFLAVPDDLMSSEFARWISYPVMLLVGVPLYICASASTPIAAALVAKGLSPGAALIFLMTGPATNSSTIAMIASRFGARFGSIYVASVITVTTVIAIVIDAIVLSAGLTLPLNLSGSEAPAIQALQWAGAAALVALMLWRFQAGALRSGYQELVSNLRPLAGRSKRA